jgi:hypothetical protein
MIVTFLEAIHYPPRRDWVSMKTDNPDWPAIESSIKRLDRDEWPYVWLHTEPPVKFEMPNNMFCVMGGRGEFALTLYRDGAEISYRDRTRQDEGDLVRIWESDQGSETWPTYLCNDLSRVLALTRVFCDSGNLDDSCEWEIN